MMLCIYNYHDIWDVTKQTFAIMIMAATSGLPLNTYFITKKTLGTVTTVCFISVGLLIANGGLYRKDPL